MGRGLQDEAANAKSSKSEHREAFFLDFATQARKRFPKQILMLTGGFRTRRGIEAAFQAGVCDLVGIGRPAVLNPDFPRLMIDDLIYSDHQAQVIFSKVQVPLLARLLKIRILGGGAETVSKFLMTTSLNRVLMDLSNIFGIKYNALLLELLHEVHRILTWTL